MAITEYDGRTNAVEVVGNVSAVMAPAVADATLKAVTVAEVTAGTAIEYSTRDISLTGSVATKTDQFLADVDVETTTGATTFTIDPIVLAAGDPQNPDPFITSLTKGATFYLIERRGMDRLTAYAAAQKVAVTQVEVTLLEDMPVTANADGQTFEVRLHLAVKKHERNASISV